MLAEDVATAQAVRDGDPAMRSRHGFSTEITPMVRLVNLAGTFDGPEATR